jgi:plasmid replication initiation protein
MDEIQLPLPGAIVKKHNKLVQSKISISNKTSARILACLVASTLGDEEFKQAYTIQIADYLPSESDGGRFYRDAKIACKELAKSIVEMEDLNDPEEPEYGARPFFISVNLKKGRVTARFNPMLAPYLLQLQALFTEYNLIEYLKLPSSYSQRLFEILHSWKNAGEKKYRLAELHNLLDTPDSFRADFAQFRRWVLNKAHKDILAHTSLRFEWQPIKAGKSVEAVLFTFGPGKRAIAEAEKEKAKTEKARRLSNQRFLRAVDCVKSKNGVCEVQDNRPIVCKACMFAKDSKLKIV